MTKFNLTDRDTARRVRKKFRRYSEGELILFAFLPQSGARINSKELLTLRKKANRWHPNNPLQVINVTMRSLKDKIESNGEKFELCRTDRRGPRPIEFWLERR